MAVGNLSPWPSATAVVARAAAVLCLKEAVGDLPDGRINALGATAAALVERYAEQRTPGNQE